MFISLKNIFVYDIFTPKLKTNILRILEVV